jgi:hypothetical protein
MENISFFFVIFFQKKEKMEFFLAQAINVVLAPDEYRKNKSTNQNIPRNFMILKILDFLDNNFSSPAQIYEKLNDYLAYRLKNSDLNEKEQLCFANQFNNFIHEILTLYILFSQGGCPQEIIEFHKTNILFYGQSIYQTLHKHYDNFFPFHRKKIKIKYYHFS